MKAGAKRRWLSVVIVLKNEQVLFWCLCRRNHALIDIPDGGQASYIPGDGKADL